MFTPEQQQIIDRRGHTTFVAAGAGTGKTSLLVECYLRAVLEDGVDMDLLPTVTFTRKAAGEMRARVRKALLGRGRPDLARRLDRAPIGTIDSFAGSLLRGHALEAGLDPRYEILDAEQSAVLQEETWDEVWEKRLRAAGEEELEVLVRFKSDLIGGLIPLYNELRGAGVSAPRFAPGDPPDFAPYREALADACRGLLALNVDMRRCSKTMRENLEAAAGILELLDADWPAEELLLELGRFRPQARCSEEIKPLVRDLQQALEKAREVLAAALLRPLACETDELLREFHSAYGARKRELGALDFPDLALAARELLARGVGVLGPRGRLIVDEFQDTNSLQCSLFDALRAGATLTVGDEFQSIYGFRGADVEVFRRREHRLRQEAEGAATPGSVASLTSNFRTRAAVLDVINHLFAHEELFGSGFRRLVPGRPGDEPRPGRDTDRGRLDPSVEIIAVEKPADEDPEEDWQEREAEVVAARVERLVRFEGWRPRDVVILMPGLTRVDRYADALTRAGIDPYVVGGRGYYAREEVGDLVAFLRVLANPHDDLALATVLRSPFGAGLPDDVLIWARRAASRRGARYLWEGLEALSRGEEVWPDIGGEAGAAELHSLLAEFCLKIRQLRQQVGGVGLSVLLDRIVSSFDYDLVVLSLPDGAARYANVRKLMSLADEYESVSGRSLPGFVRYLRHKSDLGAKEGNAATLAEDAEVVRIMTVHQAKGLEFPVVLVAGLGSAGKNPRRPTFLVGRDGRTAISAKLTFSGRKEIRARLGDAESIEREIAARHEGERIRLAYVAATRAEERLLLVGTRGLRGENLLDRIWKAVDLPEVIDGPVRPQSSLDVVAELVSGDGLFGQSTGSSPEAPAEAERLKGVLRADDPVFPGPFEPGAPVSQISFSALALYETCPRMFFLERVLGLSAQDGEDARGDVEGLTAGGEAAGETGVLRREAIQVGLAVHRVLEVARLEDFPVGAELEGLVREALEDLGFAREDAGSARGDAGSAQEDLVARCLSLCEGFRASPLSRLVHLERAEKEVPFILPLAGLTVTGFFDFLLREEERWLIADYKTNRLNGRTPAEAVVPYRLQGELYAWAALRGGAKRVTVAFLFLEDPEQTADFEFRQEDEPRLRKLLEDRLEGLLRSDFTAVSSKEACAKCPHGLLCGPAVSGRREA